MGIVTGTLIATESVDLITEADVFECALAIDAGIAGFCVLVKMDQVFHEESDERDPDV